MIVDYNLFCLYYMSMYSFAYKFGSKLIDIYDFFIGHSKFSIKVCVRGIVGSKFINPAVNMVLFRQIYYTGVELIVIMTFISLLLGIVLVGQLSQFLITLGANESIGSTLIAVVIRYAAPITTGVLLILRTSSALLIEIGIMKYNREIIALEAMNIDPYIYTYFPRVLACIISNVVLSIYFSILSIIGGYFLLSFQLDTTLDSILRQFIYEIRLLDIAKFLFKTIISGFLIASIPIYTALSITGTQSDIIKSIVVGMIRVFIGFILVMIIGEII